MVDALLELGPVQSWEKGDQREGVFSIYQVYLYSRYTVHVWRGMDKRPLRRASSMIIIHSLQ